MEKEEERDEAVIVICGFLYSFLALDSFCFQALNTLF